MNSSSYNATFANMLAALSADVYNETDIKKAYQSLGFTDFGVYEYDGAFNPNRCGYAMGFKKSEYNDDTICLISVRGSNNVSDWVGNIEFSVNDYKHTGFSYPANSIYNNIQSTLKNKNISGNVKYVLNGHSRGAAVANLLAVKLMENGVDSTNVFDYNFACPDVACRFKFPHYGNIFNLCNREDVVPHVPGSVISSFAIPGMSWGKFGQTYWFTKDDPNTLSPFADHSIELYLEFFDQQLAPSDWSSSFMDKAGDLVKKGIGWSTKIFCPVDVIITDLYGNKIASVINGKVNYYDSNFGDVIIFTDGDKKAIYVEGENYFNINLIGTDIGEMTYTVEKYELLTEKVLESKTFSNVKIEKGKKMYSPVSEAITTDDIELFVIQSENGKDIITHTINVDGTEIEKEPNPSASCKCMCHKTGFMGFIYKIARFFWKLFKTHKTCDCGVKHY